MTALPETSKVTWLPAPTFLAKESLVSKNTFYAEINRFAITGGKLESRTSAWEGKFSCRQMHSS